MTACMSGYPVCLHLSVGRHTKDAGYSVQCANVSMYSLQQFTKCVYVACTTGFDPSTATRHSDSISAGKHIIKTHSIKRLERYCKICSLPDFWSLCSIALYIQRCLLKLTSCMHQFSRSPMIAAIIMRPCSSLSSCHLLPQHGYQCPHVTFCHSMGTSLCLYNLQCTQLSAVCKVSQFLCMQQCMVNAKSYISPAADGTKTQGS